MGMILVKWCCRLSQGMILGGPLMDSAMGGKMGLPVPSEIVLSCVCVGSALGSWIVRTLLFWASGFAFVPGFAFAPGFGFRFCSGSCFCSGLSGRSGPGGLVWAVMVWVWVWEVKVWSMRFGLGR